MLLMCFLYNLCNFTSQQLQLHHMAVRLSVLQVSLCVTERFVTALASLCVFWHSQYECCCRVEQHCAVIVCDKLERLSETAP